ncbi:amino acid adenylation domain-containing protein [Pseudoalteromonas sp. JBTF-M23]|uniref:Amino acid adenylation domain-containing protein n=1 Tax=Pseudoalteromonas caenipelagi TaxID=2726988 RepID=A0A849VG83_9GAMM|nr:non-ribosomal peptide synthetase [Pseudoalteromonas caenipelagi]NOU50884.1 amino acid adenylation domain-containing protein [Pseudoalteromonas caenipelagi]
MSIEVLIAKCQQQGISFSLKENAQLDLHAKAQPSAELVAQLKQHKTEIISYLQRHKLSQLEKALAQPIAASSATRGVVSFQQQRMWLVDTLRSGAIEYHLARSFVMKGPLQLATFQQALTHVIDQNEVLKTTYAKHGDTLYQHVMPDFELPLSIVDHTLQHVTPNRDNTNIITQFINRPFNLSSEPPLRLLLQKYSSEHFELTIVIHHIAADGWSIALFCQHIAVHYAGLQSQKTLPVQPNKLRYIDFACWQRHMLNEQNLALLAQWWQNRLKDCQPNVTFALDNPRAQHMAISAKLHVSHIDSELCGKIEDLAKQLGTTPFTIIYSAFSILLAFHGNETDTLIGTPIANREHEQTSELIGFIANTVLLRHQVDYTQSFSNCVTKVKSIMTDAFAHSQLPFEVLLDSLDVPRHANQPPLINVFLAMHNMKAIVPELQGVDITPSENQHRLAKFDITLDIYAQANALSLEWEYAAELFEKTSIEQLAQSFEHLLTQLLSHPNDTIQSLDLLSYLQADKLMADWQGAVRDYSHLKTLPDALLHIFTHFPECKVVEDPDTSLNYRQFTHLIEQYTHALLQQKLGDNSIIGVCCKRSINMLAMMIAVWRSGHAYLPLDPHYPKARLRYMLEDTQAPLVLCDNTNYNYACELHENVRACETLQAAGKHTLTDITPTHTAYIIYTSGSTGKPKGVLINHASLLNFVAAMVETLELNKQTRALAITSISFDIHILELFAPLLCNGYVYIANSEQSKDPQQLQNIITEQQLNLVQATPTTWKMLQQFDVKLNPNSHALSGGEPLNKELLEYFFSQPVCLWNMYGPTETTVWSALTELSPSEDIHLGTPIANTQFYIVNNQLQLVPSGTSGELLIAGDGLAIGYLNRDEETQQRFIDLPLPAGKVVRAYRTGDLVKVNQHGQLLCLGRIDQQIKLNGFRIEVSEIESVLMQHFAVQAAAVVLSEHNKLVAYIVAESFSEQLVSQLHAQLNTLLPTYMCPQHIIAIDALPKTPNNKTDRTKLAQMTVVEQLNLHDSTQLESYPSEIVVLWQKKLQKTDIYPHMSFFEQGGNSIQFIDLLSSISHATGKSLVIKTLLANPTLDHMHNLLMKQQTQTCDIDLIAPVEQHPSWQHETIYIPSLPNRQFFLSCGGKHHLWMVNHSIVLNDLQNKLSFELITQAMLRLIAHHPALRTGFKLDRFQEYICDLQSILAQKICFDLSALSRDDDISNAIEREISSIRLNTPLIRLFFVKRNDRVFLTLSLHHVVFDGFSMAVLTRNFITIVEAMMNTQQSVTLSTDNYIKYILAFTDYFRQPLQIGTQQNWQADLAFWQQSAKHQAPRMFSIEATFKANMKPHHASESASIPSDITQRIKADVSKQHTIRESDIHTAAIARALQRTFNLGNVSIELSQFNRAHSEISVNANTTVGYLVSPFVLSITADALQTQHSAVNFVAQFMQQAPHNAIGHNALIHLNEDEKLLQQLAPIATPDFNYNYQGELSTELNTQLLASSLTDKETALKQAIVHVYADEDFSSPHSLYISTYFENKQQYIFIGYSNALFEQQQITSLINNYLNFLEGPM